VKRNVHFLLLVIASFFIFGNPLKTLFDYSMRGEHQYDQYSHTLLIPFVALGLLLFERKRVFRTVQYSLGIGAALLLGGVLVGWPALRFLPSLGAEELLSIQVLGLVLFWIGGFVLCYGTRALQTGVFPLMFLFLTVPIPGEILDKPVTTVQYGSTYFCSLVFSLLGVPFLRQGTVFSLPNISIEVAKECSGIHSTLALVIVSLLAGHLYLSSIWKKVVLVLMAIPIVCISNGLRIAGLTLLSVYVNPEFLYGNLHRKGGIGFFLVAMALLFGVVWLLRKGEHPASLNQGSSEANDRPLATPAKL
jgi:exosortase